MSDIPFASFSESASIAYVRDGNARQRGSLPGYKTRRQAELVRSCIERRGGSTSTLKDAGGKMLGLGQAMSGMFVGDEVMKGSIASYAFEAMEIASYQILISTAREVGDEETARVCERILQEEEGMAEWLRENLPL